MFLIYYQWYPLLLTVAADMIENSADRSLNIPQLAQFIHSKENHGDDDDELHLFNPARMAPERSAPSRRTWTGRPP